ncbi:Fatty acid hydroxylase superfamily protein [Legionella moravica]|uniref:Fatty acid hydroxylase superfamily n=1 Tax=Legionella moravica TaxID=39962 RepID=A0A378K3A9_9GAMM|nr:sterol desaturase family protein [Legionella moravica]KTD35320.1 Fatty acid hydroxylase superfamily protein [Legionella moravica]STX62351.1 Fatty acid hydroxylase superfamily [Legionella moravica]
MNNLNSEQMEVSKQDLFNYYGDFFLLPLVGFADAFYIYEYSQFDFFVFLSFFIGFFVYGGVLEYGFHRFIYHGRLKSIKRMHLIHHKFPQAYVSSPPYVTAILLLIFHLIFLYLLGYQLGCAFVGGIAFGYFWYITIHHMIHHVDSDRFVILNHYKKEHQIHHEHAKQNYCVSQPFWNSLYRLF